MRKHLIILLAIIATTAAAVRFIDTTESLDRIALGTTRAEVEAIYGSSLGTVTVYEDSNSNLFDFGSERPPVAIGNHPETVREEMTKARVGHAYGDGFPCVGYGADDRVVWVYGRVLRRGGSQPSLKVRQLPWSQDKYLCGSSFAEPRPGYCMNGPWAMICRGGRLEILRGLMTVGEETSEGSTLCGLRTAP